MLEQIPLTFDLRPHQWWCGDGETPAGVSPTSLTSGVWRNWRTVWSLMRHYYISVGDHGR